MLWDLNFILLMPNIIFWINQLFFYIINFNEVIWIFPTENVVLAKRYICQRDTLVVSEWRGWVQSGGEGADTGRKANITQGVTWPNGCLLLPRRYGQVSYFTRCRPKSELKKPTVSGLQEPSIGRKLTLSVDPVRPMKNPKNITWLLVLSYCLFFYLFPTLQRK